MFLFLVLPIVFFLVLLALVLLFGLGFVSDTIKGGEFIYAYSPDHTLEIFRFGMFD